MAAYGLGRWVPRAAFFLWLGLGAVDLGWAFLTLRGIEVRYRTDAGVFTAGRGIVARLSAGYRGWLPPVPVVVREGAGSRLPFIRDAAGERLRVIRGGPAPPLPFRRRLPARRGRYRLGPLEVVATGPFGLGEAAASVLSQEDVVVLPRLWPLPGWPRQRAGQPTGRAAAGSRFVDPALVAGVRPLLPGDPPRRIHWPRSALTGTWQVKDLEPVSGGATLLLLDLAAAAYDRPGGADLCDAAVELAAAIAQATLAHGEALTLLATGRRPIRLSLRAGAAGTQALLHALAEARPDGPEPLADHLRFSGTRLVVVTPAPAAAWGATLASRRRGAPAAAVLLLAPSDDRTAAERSCATLRRLGIAAWAATGAPDLARQLPG